LGAVVVITNYARFEYNNVQYEPSFECRFNTIFEFLNSKIWETIKIEVNEYNQRCGIKELMLDWEIHNKQVNIIQNTKNAGHQ
jgi:hypothetical protein